MKTLFVADHFCGAGGTSTGIAQAAEALGIDIDLLAINHWQVAIDTHTAAHPWARHVCQELQMVKPREAVPGGRLHLLVASPECTNHSVAKGGRPKDEQSRATGWDVLKWLQELYVDNLILENVKEWRKWGPLGANGKPLKSRVGETYKAYLDTIRHMGYIVEERILNCADFGAPTSRERLFVIARRASKYKSIPWPEPTHSRLGNAELFGSRKPYRTAREIIDWTIPNPSIFTRKKPLADTTMTRILAGLAKVNPHLAPFLVHLRGTGVATSVDQPLRTIAAGGNHIGVCEPCIIPQFTAQASRSLDKPLNTLTTTSRGVGLAEMEAVLVTVNHGEGCETRRSNSINEPMPTLTCKNGLGVAEAVIVPMFSERDGQAPRSHSIHEPFPTVTTQDRHGVAEAVIVPIDNKTSGGRGARSVGEPLSTIVTENRHGVAEAFVVKYYGTGVHSTLDEPLDTITTKERFGFVEVTVDGVTMCIDIRFRMLQPHELAAATTFPANYPFTGNKSQRTKQIGNAVPPIMGQVLAQGLLEDYLPAKRRKTADVYEMAADRSAA